MLTFRKELICATSNSDCVLCLRVAYSGTNTNLAEGSGDLPPRRLLAALPQLPDSIGGEDSRQLRSDRAVNEAASPSAVYVSAF